MDAEPLLCLPIPKLAANLRLFKAAEADENGEPLWTLHNPTANTFYRIKWPEFECLARFPLCKDAAELMRMVNNETTLNIEADDILNLIYFLQSNGLIDLSQKKIRPKPEKQGNFIATLLSHYLYFTIPLFRPQNFLTATLPFVAPLLSRTFFFASMAILCFSIILTLGRVDEFFTTFTGLNNFSGWVKIALTLAFVKIIHEMAHAYTAVKNGSHVPHMGLAFMVLMPVLYTETTDSWKLSTATARFNIGFAGIRAELCLAAFALLCWNFVPTGSALQTLCFMVVAVSLVSSLMVNLNPLMRFDGYYMLSDLMRLDNLQHRAIAFAKWKIRTNLLGLNDPLPENTTPKLKTFLTRFGLALIIYRFFLFSGIALAVYHLFLKPLGLILFLVEVGFFIIKPVYSEFKIWLSRRHEILGNKKGKSLTAFVAVLLLLALMPSDNKVTLPAVWHAGQHTAHYPPNDAEILSIHVAEGDEVVKNKLLITLRSTPLQKSYEQAQQDLEKLLAQKRQLAATTQENNNTINTSDEKIAEAEEKISALKKQIDNLNIKASHNGKVVDMLPGLKQGRFVQHTDLLFRIVNEKSHIITAYATESDLQRLKQGNEGFFIKDADPLQKIPLTITTVSETAITSLEWPELASPYGGAISAEFEKDNSATLKPIQSYYQLNASPIDTEIQNNTGIRTGTILLKASAKSPFFIFINKLAAILQQESSLN